MPSKRIPSLAELESRLHSLDLRSDEWVECVSGLVTAQKAVTLGLVRSTNRLKKTIRRMIPRSRNYGN